MGERRWLGVLTGLSIALGGCDGAAGLDEETEAPRGARDAGHDDARAPDGGVEDAVSVDPDECPSRDGCCEREQQPSPLACGINGRGSITFACVAGEWTQLECQDPDECRDGESESAGMCGEEGLGSATRSCVAGQWQAHCADRCADGSSREGTTDCGFDGHLQQLCMDGVWQDQGVCASTHADDAELLAGEAAGTLSYRCEGPPLTRDQIIARFPLGMASWTPDYYESLAHATHNIITMHRSCNDLTGCGEWTRISGLDWHPFVMGYVLDVNGQLYFWQAKAEPPGYAEVYIPVDSGLSTVTLTTDEDNFETTDRFLIKVTEQCFALSTLVHRSAKKDGKWGERVAGTFIDWTWLPEARPAPQPAPVVETGECPYQETSIAELASAWFSPGDTKVSINGAPVELYRGRQCTPYTGCTPWVRQDGPYEDPTLSVSGTNLRLTIFQRDFTLGSDGKFGDDQVYGHVTPECIHAFERRAVPAQGNWAGGEEYAGENILYLSDRI